jgi:hypothetical protein
MEYRLLVDLEVIEVMDKMPKAQRRRFLALIRQITGAFPSNYSDYHEADAVGRRVEVCILSPWAIHYWIDGADRHVKILAIRHADV